MTNMVVAKTDKERKILVKAELEKAKGMIARVAPRGFMTQQERLLTCYEVARRRNPELLDCDPKSVVLALAMASSLGMLPNTPLEHCYLIPYDNKKAGKKEAQLQVSYKGLIYLADNTSRFEMVRGVTVYSNDLFDIDEGTAPRIMHKPTLKDRGEIIGAYGIVTYRGGSTQFRWLDKDQLDKRRAKSAAKSNGPWVDWEKEMCDKTGLKYVLKQVPLRDEPGERLGRAMQHDDRFVMGEGIDTVDVDPEMEDEPGAPPVGSLAAKAQGS